MSLVKMRPQWMKEDPKSTDWYPFKRRTHNRKKAMCRWRQSLDISQLQVKEHQSP